MMRKWKGNKRGYVSIETVIVAGLVVALGAFAINEFYSASQGAIEISMDKINSIIEVGDLTLNPHVDGPIEEVEL